MSDSNRLPMYPIKPTELATASRVLARAFADYPIFTHIIPDSTDRIPRLESLFDFMLRLALSHGEVIAPSSAIEGVSIWFRSSRPGLSLRDLARAGLVELGFRIGARSLVRFIAVGIRKQRMRSGLVTEPHCLLDMIAVDPSRQRAGLGRRMIEAKLHELDEAGIASYLETSDPRNVDYYERFGFRLIREYRLATVNVLCLFRGVQGQNPR